MGRRKQKTDRGLCEHATFPVEVLAVGDGRKKIAHCLGCGRSGPAREGSAEALAALRGRWRSGLVGPIPAAREVAVGKPSANFACRGF